ncbi:MAG TPA: hypothetical protein VKK79_21395 [Candidatus Lokiarchaeia archaeon]|nr:hypothetical protein [Candidatus Lokiarchaeia archaeon]
MVPKNSEGKSKDLKVSGISGSSRPTTKKTTSNTTKNGKSTSKTTKPKRKSAKKTSTKSTEISAAEHTHPSTKTAAQITFGKKDSKDTPGQIFNKEEENKDKKKAKKK